MHLVGLTGGIASGKSTVSRRLVETHGMDLIDADVVARRVVEPGMPAWDAVVARFGTDVVAADGTLDRPALGRIVFGDDKARADLNAIVHPAVADEIDRQLEALHEDGRIVVLDVPLLVEAGVDRDYDAIVVVATHPPTQLERLVEQRGMDPGEAEGRVRSQAPLDSKLAIASHVIWNEGTVMELEAAVDRVAAELRAAARG